MFSLLKNYRNGDKIQTVCGTVEIKQWIKGIGAQQKCFDRVKKDEFFVVKQEPLNEGFTNTYNSFKDIDEYLLFKKKWEGRLTFNELIKEDTPCVEYYDLDGKWSDGWESIHDYVLAFLKLRDEYAEYPLNAINNRTIRWEDLIITEACNDEKLSLHIIVRGAYYFNNTNDQRVWANNFSEWIKLKHPESKIEIDTSVYNKNSIMRCVGSYKVGEESRPLRPYGLAKKIKDKRLFYCSYVEKFYGVVGKVSYMYLPLDVPQPEKKPVSPTSFPKVSDKEELETCKVIIKTIHPSRSYERGSWFAIGSALHTTLWGSQEGLDLFLEFSSRCPDKYNEDECTRMWSKFEREYSKGTLIYYFNQDKPKILKRRRKK